MPPISQGDDPMSRLARVQNRVQGDLAQLKDPCQTADAICDDIAAVKQAAAEGLSRGSVVEWMGNVLNEVAGLAKTMAAEIRDLRVRLGDGPLPSTDSTAPGTGDSPDSA